jgi:hypothetical protein
VLLKNGDSALSPDYPPGTAIKNNQALEKLQGLKKPITRTEGKKLDGGYNIAEDLANGGAEQGQNDDNNNRDQNKDQCVFN